MKTLFAAALTAGIALAGISATPAMAQDYGHRGGYDRSYDHRGGDGYGYRGDGRGYRGPQGGYRNYGPPRGDRYYRGGERCSGTTGTIVGGVVGALLGGEIGRGNGYYNRRSGTGTIVGAGVGALVGREIDRSDCGPSRRNYRR